MRLILLLLLFVNETFGQGIDCKDFTNIPLMEKNAAMRHLQASRTQASSNFRVHYYNCTWKIDPAVRYINGKVGVHFIANSNLSSITLDLVSILNVDSVKRGDEIISYTQSNDKLEITFTNQIQSQQKDSVTIYYKGVPPSTGNGSFEKSSHAGKPIIWTLSEPYGSMDWWPCKNGLDEKADSIDVFIVHPDVYKSASNGLLQSETPAPDSLLITHWKHRYPIATYLICFAVTNYAVFESTVQLRTAQMPMVTYCYPEQLNYWRTYTPPVIEQLILFDSVLGTYPFIKEKYGHVQFGWGGGMEHQTSTFLVSPNESLMAHELAHQWFGDKITNYSWKDAWLNEGFATHFASYFMEYKYPQNILRNRKLQVENITSQPGGSVLVDDTTDINRIFSSRLSYNKGSHLVYMLRFKLGDEAFFRGIRAYLNDAQLAYGFASTNDLKEHLEASSGQNLTKFFKQWYEGEGYPSYNVKWSQIGNSKVKINLSQITSHPSVSFYEMPVALKFKNATQEKTIVVNNTVNNEIFINNIGFIADTVLVDPEYWLISKNNTSEKVAASNGITGVEIYPNPVIDNLNIFLHDFSDPTAVITLYNSLGQLISKKEISISGSEITFVNMTGLSGGIYFLRIKCGKEIVIKKILK
ncbi:MAG: M1 family aminopeptidase [Ferruginibacter sp.]